MKSKETQTLSTRTTTIPRLSSTLAGMAILLTCVFLPAAKASAAPEPAWSIVAASYPTNFVAGKAQGYEILAKNLGGAPTSGPISLSVTLPLGLTPSGDGEGSIGSGKTGEGAVEQLICKALGQTVSCVGAAPVVPGKLVVMNIYVNVAGGTPSSVLTEAKVEGGGAGVVETAITTMVSSSLPTFEFLPGSHGFYSWVTNPDGTTGVQAGSHPYQLSTGSSFPTRQEGFNVLGTGQVKDIEVRLPRGMVVNPQAVPRCTDAQFLGKGEGSSVVGCPDDTQVGTITVVSTIIAGTAPLTARLFNMTATPGSPARLGAFLGVGVPIFLVGGAHGEDEYRLSARARDILALNDHPVFSDHVTIWGSPSEESHDAMRGTCLLTSDPDACPVDRLGTAFLTMPSDCPGEPTRTTARIASWQEPDILKERDFESQSTEGAPVTTSGCNQLEFDPSIEAKPTTNLADSPTGLEFSLHQPQSLEYEGLSNAHLKDTSVRLPEGMAVNPSSADGLDACSMSEVGLATTVGQEPIRFDAEPAGCSNASKLGSVEVKTPLLKDPLPGAVYLAEPYENPFGSLLAIYLTVHDEERGVVAKLAGEVTPDPSTGQLSATFEENPELPLEDVDVSFFGGPRASLRTPALCGTYATVADLTPWSAPEAPDAHPQDSFAIQASPNGGACPTTAGQAPNAPSFTAGTLSPQAGAYSPFVLKVSRQDATQPIAAIEATLPPGLSARLAGTPYCPEASIAQAKSREKPNQGRAELSNPSCPASSQVGEVDVAAGAGITPLHVAGKAYLSGPYKGAPLSMVVITPAVAGPFDLGTVVVRTALQVDPRTAQVKAVSDPLPTILEGIPLDVRSITVTAAKPQFTLNPTSCDPMQVTGVATSVLGQIATLSNPFQVGGCKALPFKPKLQIRLKGKTRRGGHPALTAVATFTEGHANTKRAAVTLPRSAFLDQGHIRTVCTRVQFAADQCPKASIYGKARAFTPLLDEPLRGPVYLRSSDHELPDLVAALSGQVDVELAGRVDTVNGGIRNTFEAAPDAPVSRFVLEMQGGRKGLLINSANLCKLKAAQRKATVKLDAQSGKVWDFRPVVKDDCGGKARRGGKERRRG